MTTATTARRPLATFRLTRRVALLWLVVAVAGFFAFAYAFSHLLALFQGEALEPIVFGPTPPPTLAEWTVVSTGLVALVVVVHESIHGAFIARYGGSPSFGVGRSSFVFPYAYAESTETSYTRTEMLVVLLAPVVGITTAGVFVLALYPSPVLVVALAANTAGSIGDLWMAVALLHHPPDVRVAGLPDGTNRGFAIYRPATESASATSSRNERRPGTVVLSQVAAGTVGTFALVTTGLVVAVLWSLAVESGTVVVGDGSWLLFRHERHADGSVHLEVGATVALALSVAGGVVWALFRP
ncbi:DUF3267 domain-containing protein [Natronobacterium gregoryi]|uniref:Zincin peptidase n=2 Tax=Natronobacterium gregoryi TaxID=44930 RepID=L0AER1_NATGS|nr:DUF3267 domain-containing protein [Natronobacterium gregoryi]AFZ71924.1 Protein of unknown function (DUF3267) [Natronobacterium gregoryi SP2]ELY62580.1 hypothetical protein C490_17871 [Natronobacterium gregoryi SP2]PLK20704.1 hypothetical protein CYV19_08095 [Natronobacterium gregoryi SP2]SFJ13808.1 Putative zincin peptidase [Natronobacterium gregoryi]